jgi:hypothetical protein
VLASAFPRIPQPIVEQRLSARADAVCKKVRENDLCRVRTTSCSIAKAASTSRGNIAEERDHQPLQTTDGINGQDDGLANTIRLGTEIVRSTASTYPGNAAIWRSRALFRLPKPARSE